METSFHGRSPFIYFRAVGGKIRQNDHGHRRYLHARGSGKNGDSYKQTLLTLAQQNELSQAEKRVIRWMLDECGTAYDMWTGDVDYGELFSRCAEMDGALPAYYAKELEEVFLRDPSRFLQEMSVSNANLERLSTILMDRQLVKKFFFDKLSEVKEAPKTSNSYSSAYMDTVEDELHSKAKTLAVARLIAYLLY